MSGAAVLAALAGACAAPATLEALACARRVRAARTGRRGWDARGWPAGILPRLARRLGLPGAPGDLAGRVAAAGVPPWLGTGELMVVKCAFAGCAAAAALLAGPALPGRLGALVLVAGPALGFAAPDLLLIRRARLRARAARAEAADLFDRVRLAADAGLSTAMALTRAARDGHGPLAAELRALAAATDLGVPREEALRGLTARLPVPEVHALAAAVRRTERHGAPLGAAAAALAADARAGRARRVRDRAQRAAPKIQLIVALLLVPAVLLLVAAGLLAGLR